jgi:hypothetical protein
MIELARKYDLIGLYTAAIATALLGRMLGWW